MRRDGCVPDAGDTLRTNCTIQQSARNGMEGSGGGPHRKREKMQWNVHSVLHPELWSLSAGTAWQPQAQGTDTRHILPRFSLPFPGFGLNRRLFSKSY